MFTKFYIKNITKYLDKTNYRMYLCDINKATP